MSVFDPRVWRALRHPRITGLLAEAGHPDGAAHELLGLATTAALDDHATTPHGGEAGPHTHDEHATDADLGDHAATPHGLASHAIDGAFHTGAAVLPTAGQKNALAGTSGTPGDANRYVTGQDTRLSDDRDPNPHVHTDPNDLPASVIEEGDPRLEDARAPLTHSHGDADLPADLVDDAALGSAVSDHETTEPHLSAGEVDTAAAAAVTTHANGAAHTGLATDAEVTDAIAAHEATTDPHAAYATEAALATHADDTELHAGAPGATEAFPVGSIFISAVATDPATLLGYGTWEAFAAGRMLVGFDAGQAEFDTLLETGGAKTHTLTEAEMPAHTHVIRSQTATSGAATSYEHGTLDTSSAEAEATEVTDPRGGGGAHNNLPPYLVVHIWRRTA